MTSNVNHVYPLSEEEIHTFEGIECVCKPRAEMPCTQCEDGLGNCWRCNNQRFVTCEPHEIDSAPSLIIIHKRIKNGSDLREQR